MGYADQCAAQERLAKESDILQRARKLVDEQAEDEGLWFDARYISEAYLQDALRKLHEVIEDKTQAQLVDEKLELSKERE